VDTNVSEERTAVRMHSGYMGRIQGRSLISKGGEEEIEPGLDEQEL
jgi:hypothetical protein